MFREIPEELSERVKPILEALIPKLKHLLESKGEGVILREDNIRRIEEDEQSVRVYVNQMQQFGEQSHTLKLVLKVDADHNRQLLIELTEELAQELYEDVTEGDFQTLCEFGLQSYLQSWQQLIEASTPEHLEDTYSDDITYGQWYEAQEAEASAALEKFYDEDDDFGKGITVYTKI